MRFLLIILFYSFSILKTFAQTNNYWVFFKDKPNKATELNAPVNGDYLLKIASNDVNVIGSSKWFNAAYVSVTNPKVLKKIEKLSFVDHIEYSKKYRVERLGTTSDTFNYGQADVQINMLGLQKYHQKGYTGKGIILALFDGGFYKVDSNIAFDSLRKRKGILATRDFVKNDSFVYDDNEHGMYVLSLVAGYVQDSLVGAAPDVQVLLARTEDVNSEKHIEEFNWVRAVEWADSNKVDIIHSSLGYSLFDSLQGNYSYQDMDGKSTIISRAAQLAFQRGIFITNSAGNEGKKTWKHITAPCDAKDVLCVGAVDSFGRKSDFSSFGPSADGRVKPDVMAMGSNVAIISTKNIMMKGGGTSFSGPLIAGFVACLKQAFPNVKNTVILDAIRRSGSRYLSPTDSMGYGIPDIGRADSLIRYVLGVKVNNFNLAIKVFPNPCTSSIQISSSGVIKNVEIIDEIGRIFKPQLESGKIDMHHFKPGIYCLRVMDDKSDFTIVKIVKQEE